MSYLTLPIKTAWLSRVKFDTEYPSLCSTHEREKKHRNDMLGSKNLQKEGKIEITVFCLFVCLQGSGSFNCYYYFFNLFIFNWSIVALQCCVGFCHTST